MRQSDRVLVLGSSGWFGREFAALLTEVGADRPVVLQVGGPSTGTSVSQAEIADFDPTVVVNFAFLTRERVQIEGEEAFTSTNRGLTDRFIRAASMSNVRMAVTVSSGATVSEPEHPYGKLKQIEESEASELVTESRSIVVLRAYSVSGGYVRRPHDYAFSDFISQASTGTISVKADHAVFRRYCSVADALTAALRAGDIGRSGILETGGDLVEMGELAYRVAGIVNPRARVERAPITGAPASRYHSDNRSWSEWLEMANVRQMDLDAQITATAEVLLS